MSKIMNIKTIRAKLILSFILVSLLISVSMGTFQYFHESKKLIEGTRGELIKLATAATYLIDGDEHQQLKTETDQDNLIYNEIRDRMQEFQKDTGIDCIYTLVEDGEDQTKFIIDAAEEDPAPLGYEYDYLPAMHESFDGVAAGDKEIYTDEWGTFLSGYAPIKNSQGQVVAIVGIDMNVSFIKQQQQQLLFSILTAIFISMILALGVSIFLSKKFVKPLKTVINRLQDLASVGGDLTQRIEVNSGDELDHLADAVNVFIGNIRDLIAKVVVTTENVSTSTEELNSSVAETQKAIEQVTVAIQKVATGTNEQASGVDKTTEMVEGIVRDINANEQRIKTIDSSFEKTRTLLDEGVEVESANTIVAEQKEAVYRTDTVFKNISGEIENIATNMDEITVSSRKINETAQSIASTIQNVSAVAQENAAVAEEVSASSEEQNATMEEIASSFDNMADLAKELQETVSKFSI